MIEEGLYFGMPEAEYHAAPGLSMSGMKALSESPLVYWHRFIAKQADEPSPAARFGSLAHCRLLEPKRFTETWAVPPSIEGYPGALCVQEDLKRWLADRHLPVSGTKPQQIERIQRHAEQTGEEVIIWDAILADWRKANGGKRELSQSEADRIRSISSIVHADPTASKLLSGGYPEVSVFVVDPETGVLHKARLDWMKPAATIDLKTFGRMRGQTPKQAIDKACWYEGYFRQGVFYNRIRELARHRLAEGAIRCYGDAPSADWLAEFAESKDHEFAFLFVEAEPPHHLDLVRLRASTMFHGQRLLWSSAEKWIDEQIKEYRTCVAKFGDGPWRASLEPRTLDDLDMPQLAHERTVSRGEV